MTASFKPLKKFILHRLRKLDEAEASKQVGKLSGYSPSFGYDQDMEYPSPRTGGTKGFRGLTESSLNSSMSSSKGGG